MTKAFKLPDLGEGVHEGEILAVHVSAGQAVNEGDLILEVETDKAAVEIPSPYTGTVQEIIVKVGDLVKVGDVMMTFSNGEATESDLAEPAEEKTAAPSESQADAAKPAAETYAGPVPASPATRRLARELGVDLRRITPTGPEGLVTAEDVKRFAEGGEAEKEPEEQPAEPEGMPVEVPAGPQAVPPLPDFSKWGAVDRTPFRSVRRATAKQMSLAWSQIPHVNSQDVVDITKLEAFRHKHKVEIEEQGGRLTITVFALKAVATALKTYPQFNTSLDTRNSEIVYKKYFHIGVAVNTDDGLIVPVVRDVDRKSIKELAVELNDLAARTRARKLKLEELQGGTFTITNVGAMGGGFFAPIINYPEVAILGMGQGRMQPVVKDKGGGEQEIVPRLMMPIVLCIDHRVLDGADAVQFLRLVIDSLEDPDELLMSMT